MCTFCADNNLIEDNPTEEGQQLSSLSFSKEQGQGLMELLQSQLQQDQLSKKRIGYGRERHGLYELQGSAQTNNTSINSLVDDSLAWNFRLGNPLYELHALKNEERKLAEQETKFGSKSEEELHAYAWKRTHLRATQRPIHA
ncbi:hypothetical protein PIB30_074829 [Stylosanthes scabra]|uniref:Uncharacterized protein n=1 Tax=Stylosanthes scabra TaxID=79078 RepID=A0ABU6TQ98_9FABA|nr:hypothetical protein [Stylosanthes scabra]